MAEAVVRAGVPVMAHIGLTPQLVAKLGGFKVQGKSAETGVQLLKDALAMEKAGCFAIVLEAIPDRVAQVITGKLAIPTIGIGAGPHCDGQNLVLHDMVGLFDRFTPKFVKRYANCWKSLARRWLISRKTCTRGSSPGRTQLHHERGRVPGLPAKAWEELKGVRHRGHREHRGNQNQNFDGRLRSVFWKFTGSSSKRVSLMYRISSFSVSSVPSVAKSYF